MIIIIYAVQNELLSSPCAKFDSEYDFFWIKIELSTAKDLFVGVFYRPPTDRTCLENLQFKIQTQLFVFMVPDISWEDNSVKPGGNLVSTSE